jgi:ABC-type multidrug transport system fused ATPase/permease subunit
VHPESHHVSVAQFSVRRRDSFVATQPSDAAMKVLLLFIAWCVLFVLSWPIALVALIAAPIVWLLSLPLRLIGVCVGVDPGAVEGGAFITGPCAGPSGMIRRTDMKTSPNQALEPTETSSFRGSIFKGAFRVASCLRGSVQRSAQGFIRHRSAI